LQLLFPAAWRREGSRLHRYCVAPLCVSLAAQLGTGPLLAYHFHQLPPTAPLANLVVVPMVTAALQLGLASVVAGAVWEPAALPFAACNSLVLTGMLALVRWCAGLPGAAFAVPRPSLVFMVWSVVELGLVAGARAGPRVRWAALAGLLFGANTAVWSHVLGPRYLEVVALDVGQGDATLLRFPNGRTVLIDGGERTPSFDYGESVLLPFLNSRGVRRLDAVVGTHPHADHIGGLLAVLGRLEVGWYLDGGHDSEALPARQLRQLVAARGIAYRAVAAGDSLAGFGDGGVLVLHPPPPGVGRLGRARPSLNNGSVVLRVTSGRTALLFAGDVERQTEQVLLGWGERLKAQVLKVPHHGAPTSSSLLFMGAVAPQLAVVSVGARNRFGHPSAQVMQLLEHENALPVRTDLAGAVILAVGAPGLAARSMLPCPGLPGRWQAP
jgi:competence protein ComEC